MKIFSWLAGGAAGQPPAAPSPAPAEPAPVTGPVKQVIVIRRDLKMRRGKEIAQGAHASLAFLTRRLRERGGLRAEDLSPAQRAWLAAGTAKVCVRVDGEEALLAVAAKAQALGVECHVVTDAGRTEFGGVPTRTCLALGPDLAARIDEVSGDLELY